MLNSYVLSVHFSVLFLCSISALQCSISMFYQCTSVFYFYVLSVHFSVLFLCSISAPDKKG